MRLALIACRPTPTNAALARTSIGSATWEHLTPAEALDALRPGDAALGRLDVLPTLDGIDDGVWALGALSARGVVVLNEASALLAAHDKLLTARLLHRHGVPHPRTNHVRTGRGEPRFARPVVVKPRHGSWGADVVRCDDADELAAALELARERPWYGEHGVLVQELVRPQGYDLRVIVACDRIVGAVYRIAPEGEWRTNVALGAVRQPVPEPPRGATELALAAARAVGCSFVGVDLLPDDRGGWVVIEVNGAVEFTPDYACWGDVFADAALVLERGARSALRTSTPSGGIVWTIGRARTE